MLTPRGLRLLAQCPLHFHFEQQSPLAGLSDEDREIDQWLRSTLHALHAQGGPQRLNLPAVLNLLAAQVGAEGAQPGASLILARQVVAAYHRRLRGEWAQMLASNETLRLQLRLGRATVSLTAEIDRLDRADDGGITATEFVTGPGPAPDPLSLATDPGITAFHALAAAAYPTKRPVRVRQLWLRLDQTVEVELSEAEYRRNLSALRAPVEALVEEEFVARPGVHCEVCPFKYKGCPIYLHETPPEAPAPGPKPKSVRTWSFVDDESDETAEFQ